MTLKKLAIIVATLALTASQAIAKDTIINGIDANFPPFAYIDKTGKPSGFDVECMDIIAKKLGMKVEHKPIEWDGIITALMTKKIDMVASGMSITEERAKKVSFTLPYWVIKQVFVTKKDSSLTVNDVLTGKKKLGVQQGTSEAKWLKEEAAKQGWNFTLRYYNSAPISLEDVLNGRIDAAAMDDAPAKDAVAKKEVKIIGTFGMHDEEFGYAVRKDDKELLDKVNAELKALMGSPKWNELVKKYELDK
ncbi:MAG: amino acid ABC transporter substrate-binding protein [Deltaproteobacteria bacterium]|nr:MAG: amino acid ABC transporter substrate-binding protein [Deltaproteobacteria bacterium]